MKKLWILVGIAVLGAAGCSNWRSPLSGLPDLSTGVGLSRFDACDDYLAFLKQAALERVGPYGLEGQDSMVYESAAGGAAVGGRMSSEDAAAAPEAAGSFATTTMPSTDDHGTNVQERGVDEADPTKTDGHRILTVRGASLEVVSIDVDPPAVTASIDLGLFGGQVLLDGDRAIVYGQPVTNPTTDDGVMPEPSVPPRFGGGPVAMGVYSPTTEIVQVDLAAGRVVDRRTAEGTITAGRSANGTVRLVMSSRGQPALGFVMPQSDDGASAAEDVNRSVIEHSTIGDWLPSVTSDAGVARPLVDCAQMFHPATFSGFGTLSILSIPGDLDSMTTTGLAADAQVTYASSARLYVATTRYSTGEPPGTASTDGTTTETTDIHRFDIASPGTATYQGSGRIEGHVLNQYSMSESGDALRVATTTARFEATPPVVPDSPAPDTPTTIVQPNPPIEPGTSTTTSGITVLELQGQVLVPIGRLDGLGPTEEIQAVRYLGDRAYVVTFRRTDPLYVVDLADPTKPTALGELHVNGFSSYLHPVGENRLLGIGTDADGSGRSTGGLISLYDTSDPTHPRELGRLSDRDRQYNVSVDPHAFTWDPDAQVATITSQSNNGSGDVIGVSVAGDQLREVGRIPTPGGSEERTFVTAGRLWALSWERLSSHDRSTLAELSSMTW